jgi:hypothetical protein
MITDTRKVFVLAALIVATGVGAVEMTRSEAQAEPASMNRDQAYAAARVDTVFDLVADMPMTVAVMVPMAEKGDLAVPQGCLGVQGDAQAECMDVAYEVPSEPSVVIDTTVGNTTTLMRMDAMTVAGVSDEPVLAE